MPVVLGVVSLDCIERRSAIGASNSVQIGAEHDHCDAEPLRVHRSHSGPSVRVRVVLVDDVEARDAVLAAHCVQVAVHDCYADTCAAARCRCYVREPLVRCRVVAFCVVQIGRTVVTTFRTKQFLL